MNEIELFKCCYCGKESSTAYNHKDSYGKPIIVCQLCLEKEVAEMLNERYKRGGDIRRYNEARRAEIKYRKYYEKDPRKARPLP